MNERNKRRNWLERGGTISNYNKGVILEYNYAITTYYDGELVNTLRLNDTIEAVRTFDKCADYGDAVEYATYNLATPNGKLYTKHFYRNGEVSGK